MGVNGGDSGCMADSRFSEAQLPQGGSMSRPIAHGPTTITSPRVAGSPCGSSRSRQDQPAGGGQASCRHVRRDLRAVGRGNQHQDRPEKGRLSKDNKGVRVVEVTVNGPKTWSLAGALHPEVAESYDAAQMATAEEIIGWLALSRTHPHRAARTPGSGADPAERRGHRTPLHAAAGDPHRHLHLQINSLLLVSTGSPNGARWRSLHTVEVRDSLEAINGIGHAAVMTRPGVPRGAGQARVHSRRQDGRGRRAGGVLRSLQRSGEADRSKHRHLRSRMAREHPGEDPGPALRQAWDRRRGDRSVRHEGTPAASCGPGTCSTKARTAASSPATGLGIWAQPVKPRPSMSGWMWSLIKARDFGVSDILVRD